MNYLILFLFKNVYQSASSEPATPVTSKPFPLVSTAAMVPSSSRNGPSPFTQGGLLAEVKKSGVVPSPTYNQGSGQPFNEGSLLARVDAEEANGPLSPTWTSGRDPLDARTLERMAPEDRRQYLAELQRRARNEGRTLLDLSRSSSSRGGAPSSRTRSKSVSRA
jgi:hypothetical protein